MSFPDQLVCIKVRETFLEEKRSAAKVFFLKVYDLYNTSREAPLVKAFILLMEINAGSNPPSPSSCNKTCLFLAKVSFINVISNRPQSDGEGRHGKRLSRFIQFHYSVWSGVSVLTLQCQHSRRQPNIYSIPTGQVQAGPVFEPKFLILPHFGDIF